MRRKRVVVLGTAALALALWMIFGRPGLNRAASGQSGTEEQGPAGTLQLASSEGGGGGTSPAAIALEDEFESSGDPGTRALADRWSGHVFRLREAIAAGRLGAACVEWDAVEQLSLPPAWSVRGERIERELTAALTATGPLLLQAIRAGHILEACERINAARSLPHARVETILRALAADLDLRAVPDAAASPPITIGETVPPVSEGRLVRLRFREGWQSGRVVGISRGTFTIKLETVDGVYFPVKGGEELEPVEPSLAEAMQQIALAAAAGDRLGAVLWLCHVQQRADKDEAALQAWRERLL